MYNRLHVNSYMYKQSIDGSLCPMSSFTVRHIVTDRDVVPQRTTFANVDTEFGGPSKASEEYARASEEAGRTSEAARKARNALKATGRT